MNSIEWIWTHRDEIAAVVTYVMGSIVIGIRSFRGFARGLRKLAAWTSFKWDDQIAERIESLAEDLDGVADWAASMHARLAPPPNPTPSLERVEAEVCGKRCDHGSECLLLAGHDPPWSHETQHGCVFYDPRPGDRP